MSSKRSHLRGRLPEIKTTDGEVIDDHAFSFAAKVMASACRD
ncbi:hypothetical protein ECDEC6E_1967 [Escherichia coli DEC6E]|nr:hypothetical protein ECDEC6E_1967 [Escherichia coli DEC6E]